MNNYSLDFLFIYEHKARELESICLLKAYLEQSGYICDVLWIRDLNKSRLPYSTYKKPHVVITFALYNNESFFYHVIDIVGKQVKIVNLQWEQVLSKKYIDLNFHTPKELASLATHICWGKCCYDRLVSHGIKNAVITGAIQLDFLRDELRWFYISRDELMTKYNMDKSKRLILYISSFTYATASRNTINAVEKLLNANVDDFVLLSQKSRYATLNIFEKILQTINDVYIIYRPHPGEFKDSLIQTLEGRYPNFKVISEFSLRQWILTADEIITWFSTGVAEIYYAGKNCYILRPFPIDTEIDVETFKNAKYIYTYEDLYNVLVGKVKYPFPIDVQLLKNYYDQQTNNPSYKRVSNLLIDVLTTNKYDVIYHAQKLPYSIFKGKIKWSIKRLIWLLKITKLPFPLSIFHQLTRRLNKFWEFYRIYNQDYATDNEINELTNKIGKIIK